MNTKRFVMVLVVLAFVASFAVADSKAVGNGKWLHDKWISIQRSETPRSMDLVVYDGFILGVVQTVEYSTPQAFAIPEGTTIGQLFTTVGRYLENNPADWNTDAGLVVVKALQTRFPCPKK